MTGTFDLVAAELRLGLTSSVHYTYQQARALRDEIDRWLVTQQAARYAVGEFVRVTGKGADERNGRALRHGLKIGQLARIVEVGARAEADWFGEPVYRLRGPAGTEWVRQGDLHHADDVAAVIK